MKQTQVNPRIPERVEREHKRLLAQIGELGHMLPGTLTERYVRCSGTRCRCRTNPPQLHGPYYSWTRKINGRTRTRMLTPEQAAHYAPWFGNARTLRALSAKLEALGLATTSNPENWTKI